MDLKNLIDLLPFHFKEADTYKNKEEKGILERYLQILGTYLEDDLKPAIESMRQYIAIDTSFRDNDPKDEYADQLLPLSGFFRLDYFWEFLGQMPYANIIMKQGDKEALSQDLASGKTYKPLNIIIDEKLDEIFTVTSLRNDKLGNLLENLERTPGVSESSLVDYSKQNLALLLYSVPLYKIRGTEKFFKIYFELLDLGVTLSSITLNSTSYTSESLQDKTKTSVNVSSGSGLRTRVTPTSVKGIKDVLTKLDQKDNLLDSCNLDSHPSCQKCKTVQVVMSVSNNLANISQDDFEKLHEKVSYIFDRFLPLNVKADITYDSDSWNSKFLVTNPIIHIYLWDGFNWIKDTKSSEWTNSNYIGNGRKEVKVKVVITDTTLRGSKIKYHFEVGPGNSSGPTGTSNRSECIHDSGDVITITNSGLYTIRVCENKVNTGNDTTLSETPVTATFNILRVTLAINPSITYKLLDSEGIEVDGFKTSKVDNYLYIRVFSYIDDEWVAFTIECPDGTKETILDWKDSDDDTGLYFVDYYINKAGTYRIYSTNYPNNHIDVEVPMEEEYANLYLEYPLKPLLTKTQPSIKVAIQTYLDYLGKLDKMGLCSSSTTLRYSTFSETILESLWVKGYPLFGYMGPYFEASIYAVVNKSISGYIHCFLKLETSSWSNVTDLRYIQLLNVPVDDMNSFIGIYQVSTKTLTKLNLQWRAPKAVHTPYGSYQVHDSVPIDISGYLRATNTDTYLEILSTNIGWVTTYDEHEGEVYYRDGDIIYLDKVGEYIFKGAIPELDKNNIYYDYSYRRVTVDQNIVDIGPLNYILSPQGIYFYPSQEDTGKPADSDTVKFTLTCVTNLTWAQGRKYKEDGLIPIMGILQQYKQESTKMDWYVKDNPGIFVDEDTSYSTYTLKHDYTIKYGDYNTYPTRIKLGGLVERYIDVHLGIFIDPNKNYIYLQPENPLDGGWSKPDWGKAALTDTTNTPDRVEYDLMSNHLEFTVQQTRIEGKDSEGNIQGSGNLGGRVKLYEVAADGTETYTGQTYAIGTEVISNIKTTGKYRLRGEGDYAANYIEINVISSGTFHIYCDPPVAALSAEGFATTRVTATCDTPNTPSYQLQVQRDGESVWHDVPYDFVANSLGVYHFSVRGNTAVGATFSVVSKLTVSTNKSQLTWTADSTDIQEVELTADSNLQWSVEVSDD